MYLPTLMQNKKPSLLINAFSNWIVLIVTVVIGFLLTPFIIHNIGKTGYGIWTLISSIIGYYGILDLGITSAITRYVARYAAQKNYKALSDTISTAIVLFFGIGSVIAIASIVVAGPMSSFFNVASNYVNKFIKVILLLGLAAGLGFPGNLLGAILRAHERFVASNAASIVTILIRTSLIVIFLSNNMGLVGIALSHFISTIIMISLNFTLCKILFSSFQLQLKSFKWTIVRILLGFGVATTVGSIADIMRFNLDSFVIAKWINLPSVAVYGVAALLIRYFLQFISQGTQIVLTPRFSALEGENKRIQLRQLFLRSLSISAFLSFAIGTLIIIFGRQFIFLWVGSQFHDAVPVLWVLTAAYSVALAQTPGISLVYALKKHYLFATVSVLEGIANIILSIYLASSYGILGVAIGTAVPMLVVKLIIQPVYISRIFKIPLRAYWLQILPPMIIALIIIIAGNGLPKIISSNYGYLSLIVDALPYVSIFILTYIVLHMVLRRRDTQNVFG